MTTPRKILNQFVTDHLGDVLRAGGLRKNRDRWVLVEDGNIAGIEFHANRYNCPANIQFCPNMYTICAAFLRMEGREPDPSMGSINAAFDMPLSTIVACSFDWWRLKPGVNDLQLADELRPLIQTHAIPYMQSHVTNVQLLDALTSGEGFLGGDWVSRRHSRAVLLGELGRTREFLELMDELERTENRPLTHPKLRARYGSPTH